MESLKDFKDKHLTVYSEKRSWPAAIYELMHLSRKNYVINQLDVYAHYKKQLVKMTGSNAKYLKSGIRHTMQRLLKYGLFTRVGKGMYLPLQKVKDITLMFPKTSQQSAGALYWLRLIEDYNNIKLKTELNGGEYILYINNTDRKHYKFDGYYKDPVTHTQYVYEFHGCMWHGCRLHRDQTKRHPKRKTFTNKQVYEASMIRENFIRSKGYVLTVLWECDLDKALKSGISPFKYHMIYPSLEYK